MSDCGAHTITKQRDALGRSPGYVYAKNDIPQQQTSIGYGADGRITSAGFTHQGEHKEFTYSYLPGTHLLHTLTHPNGLTLTQSYEPQRDLLTQMDYTRADALIVRRGYTYDILARPTARDLARYGTETQDTFGYNTRSESPRGLGGGLDKHKVFAPKGRAGNGVPASQLTTAHAYDQPLRWSSEYHDTELGLVYYNYRHYNPAEGRWMGRDFIEYLNLYKFIPNGVIVKSDYLGLEYMHETKFLPIETIDNERKAIAYTGPRDKIHKQPNSISIKGYTFNILQSKIPTRVHKNMLQHSILSCIERMLFSFII